MRYQVYHYAGTDPRRVFGAGAYREDWPGPAYRHVGDVEAADLDEAYSLTQHRDAPWTDGPAVTLRPEDARTLAAARTHTPTANSSIVLKIRSTSVGDVFVAASGGAYGVAPEGFEGLGPVARGVRARIARLRDWGFRDGGGPETYAAITALQDWSADRDR